MSTYDFLDQSIIASCLIQIRDNDSFFNPVALQHTGFAYDGNYYETGVLGGSPPGEQASWYTELQGVFRGPLQTFPTSGLALLSDAAMSIFDDSAAPLTLWMGFLLGNSLALGDNYEPDVTPPPPPPTPLQSVINGGNITAESAGPITPDALNSWALYVLSDFFTGTIGSGFSGTYTRGVFTKQLSGLTPVSATSTAAGSNPTGGPAAWPTWASILAVFQTDGSTPAIAQSAGIDSGDWAAGTHSQTFGGPVAAGSTVCVVLTVTPEYGGVSNPQPSVTDSQGNHYEHIKSVHTNGAAVAEADLFVAFNVAADAALTVHLTTANDMSVSYLGADANASMFVVTHLVPNSPPPAPVIPPVGFTPLSVQYANGVVSVTLKPDPGSANQTVVIVHIDFVQDGVYLDTAL